MSDYQNTLKRVRGHGAAHDGTHHFWVQRLTALALIPLTIWFVASVVCHIGASYDEFHAWVGQLPVATALILIFIIALWHAAIGLQVIFEDYSSGAVRMTSVIITKFVCFAVATMGVLAVLKIAIGA